ncbi:hypothetical protein SAMN04489718_3219 [Actinopolyspora saharensis]|uniref:Uncharacterized protein n=1 Tax=Actinopolyspora saharensis TaxID=995062 RepID=A0A1H1FT85_9ACTN|nr:hypothetical protein SAMN04489718_3219 [Actinopolyspora saharensis]
MFEGVVESALRGLPVIDGLGFRFEPLERFRLDEPDRAHGIVSAGELLPPGATSVDPVRLLGGNRSAGLRRLVTTQLLTGER